MASAARSHASHPVRWYLLGEAVTFAVAASVHRGLLLDGYQHREAFIAETIIAAVLLAALVSSWIQPRWTRVVATGAQAFALLGTLVGLLTIAIGIGPRTTLDVVYHLAIVAVLVRGLVVGFRQPADEPAGIEHPV